MGLKELRSVFGLDPTKPRGPQILSIVAQCTVLFGGPALAIIFIGRYPFLTTDQVIYVAGSGSIFLSFLISFVQFRRDPNLRRFPLILRIAFRLGWGLCLAALVWGLIGIANGLGTPVKSRQVPVVAKHHTLERDPARRTYYFAVRPWPGSRTVVVLDGPRNTYDQLFVPVDGIHTPQEVLDDMLDTGQVNLIVGKGRLGLEWLKSIEPISSSGG